MIHFTVDQNGVVYGYGEDAADQELAMKRIKEEGHFDCTERPTQYHVFQRGKWALTSEGAAKQLADAIAAAQAAASAQAEAFRQQFAGAGSLRVAGWNLKAEALKVIDNLTSSAEAIAAAQVIFKAEAQITGEALDAILTKSRTRAAAFAAAAGAVEGMERMALNALGKCESLEELAAVAAQLQAQADALKAQLLGGQ